MDSTDNKIDTSNRSSLNKQSDTTLPMLTQGSHKKEDPICSLPLSPQHATNPQSLTRTSSKGQTTAMAQQATIELLGKPPMMKKPKDLKPLHPLVSQHANLIGSRGFTLNKSTTKPIDDNRSFLVSNLKAQESKKSVSLSRPSVQHTQHGGGGSAGFG